MKYLMAAAFLLLIFSNGDICYSQVKINEVSASNDESYFTHDHDDPDWIELYNISSSTVNLSNWKIYDKNDPGKAYTLPDTNIAPKEFIIINCSGSEEDHSEIEVIESSAPNLRPMEYDAFDFYYLPVEGDANISAKFNHVDFYSPGTQVCLMFRESLEFDSRYIAVIIRKAYEPMLYVYLRKKIHVGANHHPSWFDLDFPKVKLKLEKTEDTIKTYFMNERFEWEQDKDFIFETSNALFAGIGIASNDIENKTYACLSEVSVNDIPYKIKDMKLERIHHHQDSKLYTSNEIYDDFKISNSKGSVYLWDGSDRLIDSVQIEERESNITTGRSPDGSDNIAIFDKPTPGRLNAESYLAKAQAPEVSIEPGIYNESIELEFTNEDKELNIYYTLDGSQPNDSLEKYRGEAIKIDTNCVLKARTYKAGCIPSRTHYFNYIFNENTDLPVIAINSEEGNFFGRDHGIFHESNIYRNIEIPAHLHYIETATGRQYRSFTGIKVHGSTSKLTVPMKSMRLYARDRYGNDWFEFPFFDNDYSIYKRLVLRNAGQDWFNSYIRDIYANLLARKLDKDLAAAIQPCIVYLNGKYWGLMNLQERVDEKMISTQYDIDDDEINLLEDNDLLKNGTYENFRQFRDTLDHIDIANEKDFEYLLSKMDRRNLYNYLVIRFYTLIMDWPCWNHKFWQSDEMDAAYRWIVYDSDISLAYSGQDHNFGNFFPPQCTFARLYHMYIKHKNFRIPFINYYCDLLNTTLDRKMPLALLDSLKKLIAGEIPRHQQKWEGSCQDWETHISKIRDFLAVRPYTARSTMIGNIYVYDTTAIKFIEADNGIYKVNSIFIEDHQKKYVYFNDVPITIEAIPDSGYKFKKWKKGDLPDKPKVNVYPDADMQEIEAEFIAEDDILPPIINEIMYKPADSSDSQDWFELYNPNEFTIYIGNWYFHDKHDDNHFVFPEDARISSKDYLIIAENTEQFTQINPAVENYTGNFDFGLGKKDIIRLYNTKGELMDSVSYSNESPWDNEADGTGNSLELISPEIDNNLPESWQASIAADGTPGTENSIRWITIDHEKSFECSVFPNPANDIITIKNPGNKTLGINICDILGQIIYKANISDDHTIDLDTFQTGIYLIRIIEGNKVRTFKLIKYE